MSGVVGAEGRGGDRRFWRHFWRSRPAVAGGLVLVVLYASALFAPFLAPYPPETQDRQRPYHPPTRFHLRVAGEGLAAPFVRSGVQSDPLRRVYREDTSTRYPLRFFVRGSAYRLFGFIPGDRHLFGAEAPGRIFLLGTDEFGRDVFSRLLYGARISLSVGLLGILLTYSLGLLLGGIAGYYGGPADTVLMRSSEVLMSVPALYLILALRAMFPDNLRSDLLYVMIVAILSLVLWASLARIIRGMVMSIRENDYVRAAEALGAPPLRIILRHVLPNTASFVIVAATLSVPGYILGEVALSFLGAGIQEPTPSWGNMLRGAQSVSILSSYPWVLAPGVLIFFTVLAFNFLGDGLRDALDPRAVESRR
jgi:peptide/nickel transport system permease protein